ncbi:MAG: hypothetical protein WCN98_08425 [Verrucomicrobiaceae bacterium]
MSATAAFAAEPAVVSKVNGKNVTWQHGEKAAAPRVQTLLVAGDRVSAGKGSFVEVEYLADSCKVRVDAGGSLVISETSPCAAKAQKPAAEPRVVPASVGAVEVTDKTGPFTRVNMGDGMVDASVGDSLKAGDEVFAGPNSAVTLFFAVPQCSYTVAASTVYKVTEVAPCRAAAGLEGVGAGAAVTSASLVTPGVALGVGAVVLGGAVAVIATSDQGSSNNNNPATPD